MPPIYPSTALKSKQKEIKSIADEEIVYITENGRGKYVFMSEEVLKREVENAVEEVLYEQRMREALQESRADYDAGRYYTTREELIDAVAEMRAQNAKA